MPGQTLALPWTPQLLLPCCAIALLEIRATATAAAAVGVIGQCSLLGIKAAGWLAQQWFISCSRSCSMCMWHSQLMVPVCCCLLQEPPAAAGTLPVLPAITAGLGRQLIGVAPSLCSVLLCAPSGAIHACSCPVCVC
jgi:hypothetical protein